MPAGTNNPNVVIAPRRTRSAALHFPAAIDKLGMGTMFKFYKYQFAFGGKNKVTALDQVTGHIALPLPEGLNDQLSLNYETTDLGVAAVGLMEGARTGEELKNFMSDQDGASTAGGGNAGGSLKSAAEYVVRSAAQVAGPVGGALNLAAGNVPNPYTTAIFKGVSLRQHSLTFRMTPETPEDSMMIQRIVNEFKLKSLPDSAGHFLTMPDEVEISYFGTNALYGFSRCVITGIKVNYSPVNGVPAFFKNTGGLIGAPVSVEMTIDLSEIEQLTKQSFPSTEATTSADPPPPTQKQAETPRNGVR